MAHHVANADEDAQAFVFLRRWRGRIADGKQRGRRQGGTRLSLLSPSLSPFSSPLSHPTPNRSTSRDPHIEAEAARCLQPAHRESPASQRRVRDTGRPLATDTHPTLPNLRPPASAGPEGGMSRPAEVRALLQQYLRVSEKFPNYNVRE
jgi:hypothetical protein